MGEELLRTDVRYALRTYVALEGQLRTELRCALRTYCVPATAYLLVPPAWHHWLSTVRSAPRAVRAQCAMPVRAQSPLRAQSMPSARG